MAQKSKAAARQPRTTAKPKDSGKRQSAKQQVKAAGKSSKAKVTAKVPVPVSKADLKPAPAKTPVAKTPAAGPKDKKVEPQIEKAKAALKKENVQASAPVKEGRSKARKVSIDVSPNEAASALAAKWSALYKKAEQIEAKPYNMKNSFEEKTAIVHKVLGWGYILANRNDRLEVLFKDGIKYLISNYKP